MKRSDVVIQDVDRLLLLNLHRLIFLGRSVSFDDDTVRFNCELEKDRLNLATIKTRPLLEQFRLAFNVLGLERRL